MTLSVLVVPTGPVELAAVVERVLARLARRPTVVVLSSGSEPLVEEVTALALSDRTIAVTGAPELVAAVVERGQVPRVQAAALRGRPAALGATVHAVRPTARFLGLTIPGRADPAAIEGATAALRGALATTDDVIVLLPGELGPAALPALEAVRTALLTNDTAALANLATVHPQLSGALAPIRLGLGVAGGRNQRFEIHADVIVGEFLHVVGTAG